MQYKLKMTPEQVLESSVESVKYAKQFCSDVEFSAEDATRSDLSFVAKLFSAVIKAGATVVNVPDTVGYVMPDEFASQIKFLLEHTEGVEKVDFGVHTHNDLGLAVANALAAVGAGANQVECTIDGIGERAGNASLEEIVMALKVREDILHAKTRIITEQLYPTSRLVQKVTGVRVQPNKAIVGENAFAHEAGIHQHGVMLNPATYEIMTPESVGKKREEMVLGKHSGRHAFAERLESLGFRCSPEAVEKAFDEFKVLADKKKVVSDRDIEALVTGWAAEPPEIWKLESWVSIAGSSITSQSTIKLSRMDAVPSAEARGRSSPPDGTKTIITKEVSRFGNGNVDAAFNAVNEIVGKDIQLEAFDIGAISGDADAQGETRVKVSWNGKFYNGRAVSTNIVESGIRAYIAAINALEADNN
jgi:2-isopropylmalate synthase